MDEASTTIGGIVIARKDLIAISRHWTGKAMLSDDASGERFLHGLLKKGLPATQVLEAAPWASRRGIDHYVDEANADRRVPDADMLGDLIEFTFDDLRAMKREGHSVRYVAPCDAQRWEVDKFWKDEERKADRERKRLKRERSKEERMPRLTKRGKIVHDVLSDGWTSVSNIMKVIARSQRKPRLAPAVLRIAVHRALDELIASGSAEAKTEIEHGVATRFARRSHMTGQVFVSDNIVSDNKKTSGDVASQ